MRHSKNGLLQAKEETALEIYPSPVKHLELELPVSRRVRNKFLLLKPSNVCYLVTAA